jgi:hypothetical protein
MSPANNARVLEAELNWMEKVLETRVKLYFNNTCDYSTIEQVTPEVLDPDQSAYGRFVEENDLGSSERVVFMLSLIPNIKPQMLDIFNTKNSDGQPISEFGGSQASQQTGFVPTVQTALFVLAGDNLEKRFSYHYLFDQEHVFSAKNVLTLEYSSTNDSMTNATLRPSKELVEQLTSGRTILPVFGEGFPAKRIRTQMDWDDLVLDPYTLDRVLEIETWIEHGDTLLNNLGLSRRIKPGYRSLFFGPPGTGKTLSATLLGKKTDHEVYCIDLSMVVSKYIGETEKNLERIFRRAEHKQWILFFDEADALFGKRTSISNSHDRFANQEVSYLLQRVEDFPGVAILSSNLKRNLDDAFARRFQSMIHFGMPDHSERKRLWKEGFSEHSELEEAIDLNQIATDYELSGGSIMNVIRYATLMAIKKMTKIISHNDLIRGIEREFQKEGKTLP